MLQSTNNEMEEQSNIQRSAEENQDKGTYLRKLHKIENTPFTIVEEEAGCYLTMGDYRISERKHETVEKCQYEELVENMWNTVGAYIFATIDFNNKMMNQGAKKAPDLAEK